MHGVQGQRIAGNSYFDIVIRDHLFEKKMIIKSRTKEKRNQQGRKHGKVCLRLGTTLTMVQRWDKPTGRTETKPD